MFIFISKRPMKGVCASIAQRISLISTKSKTFYNFNVASSQDDEVYGGKKLYTKPINPHETVQGSLKLKVGF